VREDGWIGAAPGLTAPIIITRDKPLTLRYLLHAHRGMVEAARENDVFTAFARLPALELAKAPAKHTHYGIRRAEG
jgi:hypothetical protein